MSSTMMEIEILSLNTQESYIHYCIHRYSEQSVEEFWVNWTSNLQFSQFLRTSGCSDIAATIFSKAILTPTPDNLDVPDLPWYIPLDSNCSICKKQQQLFINPVYTTEPSIFTRLHCIWYFISPNLTNVHCSQPKDNFIGLNWWEESEVKTPTCSTWWPHDHLTYRG